jgi:hypothetical protein
MSGSGFGAPIGVGSFIKARLGFSDRGSAYGVASWGLPSRIADHAFMDDTTMPTRIST